MIFGPYSRFHFLETAQQNSSCFRGKGCQIIMGIVVAAYTFACLRRQNNAFREDGGSWFYWILPHLLRVADCLKDNGTTNQMGQKDVRGHSLSTCITTCNTSYFCYLCVPSFVTVLAPIIIAINKKTLYYH